MRDKILQLISKTEKSLNEAEQFKKEHIGDPRYNNEISIVSLGSMLLAYRNILDIIDNEEA